MSEHEKFARMLGKLLAYAERQNIKVLMYWLWRSAEQQNEMFKAGGKTNCDGYKVLSNHQLGRAADIAVVVDGSIRWEMRPEYELLGRYWEGLGGTWGGRWKGLNDIYHFEV